MKEILISEDMAELLESIGFNRYDLQDPIRVPFSNSEYTYYPPITLSLVQQYFREIHKIHPYITPYGDEDQSWHIANIRDFKISEEPGGSRAQLISVNQDHKFSTYEEALETSFLTIINHIKGYI